MALRVLLADESATIKKVFQLSLQDYAAEVTTVNVGLDVMTVASKVKPDIIFIDVLLQKKNGYEVCIELKKSTDLSQVPVVLIWSGFMELDHRKFQSCGANAELEKPFDTEKLRGLVQALVPKTKSQALSKFLTFPAMPEFEEKKNPKSPQVGIQLAAPMPAIPMPTPAPTRQNPPPISETETYSGPSPLKPEESEDWSMESFAPLAAPDEDDFVLDAAPPTQRSQPIETDDDEAEWVAKTLTQYKMNKSELLAEPEAEFEIPVDRIDADKIISRQQDEPPDLPLEMDGPDHEIELEVPQRPVAANRSEVTLSEKQIEAIVRAEARLMIEKVVWEIVPEIATQIIEREIKRILKDNDQSTP